MIESIGDETEALYQQALDNTQWLTGKKTVMNGIKVDFSHFDFIIAICKFTPDDMTSDLKMLQKFWVTIWPYINEVIESLKFHKAKFRELEEIEAQTLKKYALQNLELQYRQKFMQEHMPELIKSGEVSNPSFDLEKTFQEYYIVKKAESDAAIEKIKKDEEKREAKRRKKLENIQNKEKSKKFAASLKVVR